MEQLPIWPSMFSQPILKPFIKWPGGKSGELSMIAASAPEMRGRFVDPFVGGGSVLLAVPSSVPSIANDICPELIDLYRAFASGDQDVRLALEAVASSWDAFSNPDLPIHDLAAAFRKAQDAATIGGFCQTVLAISSEHLQQCGEFVFLSVAGSLEADMRKKLGRIRQTQVRAGVKLSEMDLVANIEGALRAVFYYAIRKRYNMSRSAGEFGPDRLADFFFLREYAYAAMFRFNSDGDFNVPYGGVSYNRKSLWTKLSQAYGVEMRARLASTSWSCKDFEPALLEAELTAEDFVFIDPPYDSDFSDYDNRSFDAEDQKRLSSLLSRLPCYVMIVIRDTPFVRELYSAPKWRISSTDKTYMWTIKSRNDRAAVHLTITNY